MSLKDDLNLSTDAGTNVLAILTPIITYALSLPDGWMKELLVALCLVCITACLYLIKGERQRVEVDESEDIQDVLKEGRS